ncbi:sensor domain-containing diguanylate cyclase [Photobacterium swingsii]|uniref:diguanylate cyclase n=3 Tax=Photobacterium swingsii TaxID=680026 RepID=A0A2T3P9F5_9GAMM|nr:diguanylate cyclase [Photobacterium swingsii]PSW25505.1 GGDEF domain-containing protein [Photobacterium swingsii]
MTVCDVTGLNDLVEQLARQANMERWCHCLMSSLHKDLKLNSITLLVEQDDRTYVFASWSGKSDYRYYNQPLLMTEYNGVPMGLFEQAKQNHEFVRAYVSKPYKALWNIEDNLWCQILLPIQMHGRNVAYIYAETADSARFESSLHYVERLLVVLASDISARVLQQEVIHHNITRRSIEAELEVRKQSITNYLGLMRNLHEVTLKLSQATQLDTLYRQAIELGRAYLGIDRMAIFLTDFESNLMLGTYGTSPEGLLVDRKAFNSQIPDHPLVNEALSHKNHVVVKENAPLYYGKEQVGTGWNAMIAMWNGVECIGWIAVDNLINQRALTEHQKEILKLFGAAIGQQIVIRRNYDSIKELNIDLEKRVIRRTQELQATNRALEEANRSLEQLSMQDGLTGIANRRFFDLRFARYWAVATKKQVPLTVMMIDVDNFKSYNDTNGHLEGDHCLKRIASRLESTLAPYKKSIVCRYGGEEFACLLPTVDKAMASLIAEDLRCAVAELGIPHRTQDTPYATVSIGVHTTIPAGEFSMSEALMTLADKALYAAKTQGRNCVVSW